MKECLWSSAPSSLRSVCETVQGVVRASTPCSVKFLEGMVNGSIPKGFSVNANPTRRPFAWTNFQAVFVFSERGHNGKLSWLTCESKSKERLLCAKVRSEWINSAQTNTDRSKESNTHRRGRVNRKCDSAVFSSGRTMTWYDECPMWATVNSSVRCNSLHVKRTECTLCLSSERFPRY